MAFLIVAFPVTAPASRLQLGGVVVPKDQLRGAGDSVEEPLIGRADRAAGCSFRSIRSPRKPIMPAVRRKRLGRPRENCHFSTMSLAEIKAELKTMNRAERLTLVEYVEILNRLDDANVHEEVNAAMRRMDAGRKVSAEEVLDTHRRLLAEGR